MKKKDYDKPTMKVVGVLQQEHLLTGSVYQGNAGVESYDWLDENEGTGINSYLWHNEEEE